MMTRFIGCVLLSLVVAGAVLSPSGASAAELLLHWKLDETRGATAADSSGNGHDGVVQQAGTTSWTPGLFGGAYAFDDAVIDTISVTGLPGNVGPTGTWSVWANTTGRGAAVGMTANNGSQFQQYAGNLVISGEGRLQYLRRRGNFTQINPVGGEAVDDGRWRHLLSTVSDDGAARTRRVYVDGVFAGEFVSAMANNNMTRLSLGGIVRGPFDGTSVVAPYDGLLDDFGHWRGVLDDVDIALLHGLGRFSGVTLDDDSIAAVRQAWEAGDGGSAESGGDTWSYTDGLDGVTGVTGGSAEAGDAFIVLDGAAGTGVTLIAEPGSLGVIGPGVWCVLLRRRRSRARAREADPFTPWRARGE